MGEDSWIEPRTRIPFVGIIAIAFIVLVVAVFIKTQLGPLFPASDVKVESGAAAITGKASSSFYGEREVILSQKAYLRGVLSATQFTLTFTVDVPNKLLVITDGSRREEVVLTQEQDKYTALFDYNNVQTRIDIDPAGRTLIISEPGKSLPAEIQLNDYVTYQGYFTLRNAQYLFQFVPAGSYATISAESADTVPLTQQDALYSGAWSQGGRNHPVSVDTRSSVAKIEDVY